MESKRIVVVRPNGEMWEAKSVLKEYEEEQIITNFLIRLTDSERQAPVTLPYFPEMHEIPIPPNNEVFEESRTLTFKYVTRYFGWGYPRHK